MLEIWEIQVFLLLEMILKEAFFFGQVEIRKCTLCVAVSCGLFAKTIQETRAIRLPTLMYADRAPEVHVETARHSLRCPFRRWMRKFPKSHVGLIQGSRIRLVLGCVISPPRQYAESRNLGQTLFWSPVGKCSLKHNWSSSNVCGRPMN